MYHKTFFIPCVFRNIKRYIRGHLKLTSEYRGGCRIFERRGSKVVGPHARGGGAALDGWPLLKYQAVC